MASCPCASIEHRATKAYWGSGGIPPRILDIGTDLVPYHITIRRNIPGDRGLKTTFEFK